MIEAGVYDEEDRDFVWQMMMTTSTTISCVDAEVDLTNGTGVLMGTSRAPKFYNHAVRSRMVEWNEACRNLPGGETSSFRCKINNVEGDLSFTKFADDLHRRVHGNTPQETMDNYKKSVELLTDALGEDYLQNANKRHSMSWFV